MIPLGTRVRSVGAVPAFTGRVREGRIANHGAFRNPITGEPELHYYVTWDGIGYPTGPLYPDSNFTVVPDQEAR